MKVLFVPSLLFLLCFNSLQSQRNSTLDAGFFTGLNFNHHTTEFSSETVDGKGVNWLQGEYWGVGFSFGGTLKYALSENWSVDLRIGYSSLYGSTDNLHEKHFFDNVEPPDNFNFALQVHTLMIEPTFSYKIYKDFFISLGLRIANNYHTSYTYSEKIIIPYYFSTNTYGNGYVELVDFEALDYTTKYIYTEQYSIVPGMGVDINIFDKIYLTPEVKVILPINDDNISKGAGLSEIRTLQAGIAVRIPVL